MENTMCRGSSIANRTQMYGKLNCPIFRCVIYEIYNLLRVRVRVGNVLQHLDLHGFEVTETPGNRILNSQRHFSCDFFLI
jgi:hypothetical protein